MDVIDKLFWGVALFGVSPQIFGYLAFFRSSIERITA
jgi:hypothetical protein